MERHFSILISKILLVIFILCEGLILVQLLTQVYPYDRNPIIRGVLYAQLAGQILLQSAGLYGLTKKRNWGRWIVIASFMLLEAKIIYDELHPSDVIHDNRVIILVQVILAFLVIRLAFTGKGNDLFSSVNEKKGNLASN